MIIGLIGWVMPVIPGAPLFFLGLAMSIGWHPKGQALVSSMKGKLMSLGTKIGLGKRQTANLRDDLLQTPLVGEARPGSTQSAAPADSTKGDPSA